jgi:hypothetical protein
MYRKLIIIICFIGVSILYGQKSKVTFGLQYKPIVPIKVLNVEDIVLNENGFDATISPVLGHNFGAIIRWGGSNKIAFESGLSYVRRNFNINISLDDSLSGSLQYGVVNYEIPFQGLFYVRLSKQFYMNAATGISLNFRASDVGNFTDNRQFSQITLVQYINMAYIANLGFEFRSKNTGTFYLGASLSTLFRPLGKTTIYSEDDINVKKISSALIGNYLSIDLRYFFKESKKN